MPDQNDRILCNSRIFKGLCDSTDIESLVSVRTRRIELPGGRMGDVARAFRGPWLRHTGDGMEKTVRYLDSRKVVPEVD